MCSIQRCAMRVTDVATQPAAVHLEGACRCDAHLEQRAASAPDVIRGQHGTVALITATTTNAEHGGRVDDGDGPAHFEGVAGGGHDGRRRRQCSFLTSNRARTARTTQTVCSLAWPDELTARSQQIPHVTSPTCKLWPIQPAAAGGHTNVRHGEETPSVDCTPDDTRPRRPIQGRCSCHQHPGAPCKQLVKTAKHSMPKPSQSRIPKGHAAKQGLPKHAVTS